VDKY
jgi:hypothetical protein